MRRTSALLGLAVAASFSVPLLTAGPAQATAKDCMQYLESRGYVVGPKVTAICTKTEADGSVKACVTSLVGLGVSSAHAVTACEAAKK
ncbi:hypothetical protein [Streptomyces bluensis]|uniref:hypothetical protein n=1 Tax=Streptomyces bluensis TaxID=33897 RepID=UPI00332AD33D